MVRTILYAVGAAAILPAIAVCLNQTSSASFTADPSLPLRPDSGRPGQTARALAVQRAAAADLAAGHCELLETAVLFAATRDRAKDGPTLCRLYRCSEYDEAICRLTIDWAARAANSTPPPSTSAKLGLSILEPESSREVRRRLEAELADHLCDRGDHLLSR